MATLLGTANIQGAFTTACNDVSVVTSDFTRVTQTAYRDPITIHIQGEGVIDTRDYRAIYDPDFGLYAESDYFDSDNGSSTDYVFRDPIFTAGFATPGNSELLKVAYDFLDIDPSANISSVEAKMDFEPTEELGSDPDYGTLQMAFLVESATDPQSAPQTITSGDRQTMTFPIPASGTWPSTGLGEQHTLEFTAGGYFKAMRIYRLQARVNYTGRTRFTTGFKSYTTKSVLDFIPGTDTNPPPIPTEFTRLYKTEGYGFSIPSDHAVDGIGLLYGFGAVVDGTYPTSDSLHFKTAVGGTHTRVSTNGMPSFFGGYLSGGGANSWARLVNTQDEDNTRTQITSAEVNDSTFGMEARFAYEFASTRPSEPVVFDINIAYVGYMISGDIGINTVSTVSATPVMTHGNTADEIDDFVTTTSLTAVGGFLLEATSAVATAVTTTLGTAGRIRPGEAAISTAFTTSVQSGLELTTTTFSFPTASVADIVDCGITTTTPAQASAEFTQTFTADALGLIRTGFDASMPAVSTTVVDTDQVFVLALPEFNRTYFEPAQTRTHVIPLVGEDRAHERTIYVPQHTRTHIIPIQGEDRSHERHIVVEAQTRSAPAEGL